MNENENIIQDGTTTDYLNQLISDRDDLADNLTAMGVPSEHIETFTELVPKVLQIPQGSGSNIQFITDNSDQNPFIWTENEPGIYAFYDETNQQLASAAYMQYDENANVQQMVFTGLLMLIDNTIDDPYVTGKQIGMVYNVSESKLIGIETAESPYNLTYSFAQGLENYVNTQFNQTIGGVKTFTSLPQSDAQPQNNTDLVNKKYVDVSIGKVTTMPTASSTNRGEVVQYMGTTTQDYTNGYFYECVGDGQDPETFSWVQKDVQPGSSYELPIASASTLGGIKKGDNIDIDVNGVLKGLTNFKILVPDFISFTSSPSPNDSQILKDIFSSFTTIAFANAGNNSIFWVVSNSPSMQILYMFGLDGLEIYRRYDKNSNFTRLTLPDVREQVGQLNTLHTTNKTNIVAAINELVTSISLIPQFDIEVVQALPTQDISTTTVYLLTNSSSETGNLYDEYIYVNNAWEKLGSQTIDLTNYYTKTETNGLLDGKVTAYTTLPTASASNEGEIAQYLGADDGTYHKGYFYQVTSDGETPATYKWSECDVQSRPDLSGYYSKSEVDALVANNEIPFGVFDLTTSATSSDIVTAFGGSTAFDEIQEKLKTHKDVTFVYKDNNDTVTTYPGRVLYTYKFNGAMRYIVLDAVYSNQATGQIHRRFIKLQYLTDTWSVTDVQDDVITTQDDLENATSQFAIFPTADASNLGRIVQYIGPTSGGYTQGYFYQVVSDGEPTPTYSWEPINVQPSSGGDLDIKTVSLETPMRTENGSSILSENDKTALSDLITYLKSNTPTSILVYMNNVGYLMSYDLTQSGDMDSLCLSAVVEGYLITIRYEENSGDVQTAIVSSYRIATSEDVFYAANSDSLKMILVSPYAIDNTQHYADLTDFNVTSSASKTVTTGSNAIIIGGYTSYGETDTITFTCNQPSWFSSSQKYNYRMNVYRQGGGLLDIEMLVNGITVASGIDIDINGFEIGYNDEIVFKVKETGSMTPYDTHLYVEYSWYETEKASTGTQQGYESNLESAINDYYWNSTIPENKLYGINIMLPNVEANDYNSIIGNLTFYKAKITDNAQTQGVKDFEFTSDITYVNGQARVYTLTAQYDTSQYSVSNISLTYENVGEHNRMPYTLNIIDSSNVQLENTGEVPMGTNNSYGVPVTTDTYFPGGTTVDITFYDTYVSIQQNNYDGTSVGSLVGEVINGSKIYVLPEGYYYIIQLLKMPILGTLTSTFSAAELAAMPNACSIYLTNGDAAIKEKMLEAQMRNLVTGLSNPMNAGYKIDGKDVLVQRAKINEALDTYGIGYYVLSMSLPSGSSIEKIEGKCVDTTTGNILFFPCGIVYATYDAANDYIELNYDGTVSSYNNTYVNVYYTRT